MIKNELKSIFFCVREAWSRACRGLEMQCFVSLSTVKPLEILEAIYVCKPEQRDLAPIPKDIATRTVDDDDLDDDVSADSSCDESSVLRPS